MKNWLKTLLIITILISSSSYGFEASAQISIYGTSVEDIKDGHAILKWRTNQDVKSEIYYGLDIQNLNTKLSYPNYTKIHEANFYGLEEDEDYYYKIILYSRGGEKLELYPRSFSTDDMEDTRAPYFVDAKIVQTVGNAVALSWEADEKVKTEISYWKEGDSENKKVKKINSYRQYNEYFLYGLDTRSQYYIKILIKDKADNKRSKTFAVSTYGQFNKDIELSIRNLEPKDSQTNLVSFNQATIKFQTNLAGKAYIKYGSSPNKLKKKININDNKLAIDHEVTIKDLEANTTYYYTIYISDAYKKKLTVKGLSFTSKASVLGVKESAENIDSDNDQLSDAFEISISTNPYDPDSDNDGYHDGLEVQNGYDPLGPGKWYRKIDFYYGQPRLDLAYEKTKANELKKAIESKIKYIPIDPATWPMLVNAYVYGDYPIGAIIMYVKLDGYTVHPDVPWSVWKDNPNYLKYEKYIK